MRAARSRRLSSDGVITGFQEFQELKVRPLQATLWGPQAENDNDTDNLAVQFERHARGQILLAR